mmetsp:Transcript_30538/g.63763  ORF Transcript_30538/g.63763 Transcript_30538/m.63763 type:complete len:676 (-) Transcript_30538:398-2425(-)
MDHPDSGPDSHRKRSAAQQRAQYYQQQQPPPQHPAQPANESSASSVPTTGRRRVAQERYLAAVAASSTSGNAAAQPSTAGAAPLYSNSRQPQHTGGVTSGPGQQQPPPYPIAASGQQPPPNMQPGGVAYAQPPIDPYRQQQPGAMMYQQPPPPQGYGHRGAAAAAAAGGQAPGYAYHGNASYGVPPPQQVSSSAVPQQHLHHGRHHQQQQPPPHHHHGGGAGAGLASFGPGGDAPSESAAPAAAATLQPGGPAPLGRPPSERPLIKLSVSLIDTYKQINSVYYEERDQRRRTRAAAAAADSKKQSGNGGANNNGWDDENYDYIITSGEIFFNRYKIKERIGKGSFGQVVRAEDLETKREVAIKIIKSKKPFLMQAKTEIELLTHLWEKDPEDQHNVVRLLTHFMYRNHQCLVFEMLSLNLYELLKNTQFGGVSLNLIRKFAKQVLRALSFLARPDVDVIHCDLKPENILLRHPKKSGVKVIDFGSSCRSNKRMYSYIQSRFYRSPEVMLGLPYSVAIDMWSLGCILVEMHTGEPLFSGSDQFDQMQKIVKILGMMPTDMLDRSTDHIRYQFFDRKKGQREWTLRQTKEGKDGKESSKQQQSQDIIVPSTDPIATLTDVVTAGAQQKKKYPPSEAHNSQRNYELFIDLVYKMLSYNPEERIKPEDALEHPFLTMVS